MTNEPKKYRFPGHAEPMTREEWLSESEILDRTVQATAILYGKENVPKCPEK
jgi:hypothetical protein